MSNLLAWMRNARAQMAARLVASGVGSAPLVVAGFAIGLTAVPLIAMRHGWIAVIVLFAGFSSTALGRTNADMRWRDLSQTFDLLVLAGAPFAFALADASRALVACFLLFGLVTTVAASQFMRGPHGLDTADRLVGIVAFLLACTIPQWFSPIAYTIGLAAFVAAGTRVSLALTRSSA
ncbi:MAG: hypothetical protein WDM89_12560 [Rhizomicrobium sp.]